ncbi:hypothetical protein MMC16_002807 [Acarospora aff. strigata]|nr:hypothetical protein [Acarospora aff. strigata]
MTMIALAFFTALFLMLPVIAQVDYKETIWSSVIFTRYGERTPVILPGHSVLTPLGAQQLYSAGSAFRGRYIAPQTDGFKSSSAIRDISTYEIDNDQLSVLSTVDQYVVASAQAFVQGLYPPLNAYSNQTILNSMSVLSNGSNIDFPLNGYQYPQIYSAYWLDPNSVWLAGHANCPAFATSRAEYIRTDDYVQTSLANQGFYEALESSFLRGEFPHSSVGYHNAYSIFDYLNYGYTHNRTVRDKLSASDLARARTLADHLVYTINGNISASGRVTGDRIRTIAGQTFATQVLGLLFNNIETDGAVDKISVLFGSFEPFVAFAALARLPSVNPTFYGLPDFGSSMVFEMFSVDNKTRSTYPGTDELKVRFLFRNGTNATSQLVSYPLFGRARSQTDLTFQDFLHGMKGIMLPSVGDWCDTCGSISIFCAAYSNNTANRARSGNGSGGVSPVVGGVIGAVVTLAVAGLLFSTAMWLGGIRFCRLKAKRRSELGGFRGGEKLASDRDLPAITGRVDPSSSTGQQERVGSWELTTRKIAAASPDTVESPRSLTRRSSEEEDLSVNPFSEPVKIDERV